MEAVIHEFERKNEPVFWWTQDRIVVQQLAGLHKRMCIRLVEYADNKDEIARFHARIDRAIQKMPASSG